MKILILYDTKYGNTEKVARKIGDSLTGEVRVLNVHEASLADLKSIDLLIVGSPTQGGKPTPLLQEFVDNIPESLIRGVKAATFDTRISSKIVGIFGFAAGKLAGILKKKGALVISSEGFFVNNKNNSLKEGELERVINWAKDLLPQVI